MLLRQNTHQKQLAEEKPYCHFLVKVHYQGKGNWNRDILTMLLSSLFPPSDAQPVIYTVQNRIPQ